jgi:putative transcriptional regulator
MASLQGQLILDGGQLVDSEFHRAVVLVCWHNPEGAFGLILNRSSPHLVGESLEVPLPASLQGHHLHIGGPVRPQALSCLIHMPSGQELVMDEAEGGAMIWPGLYLAHSVDMLSGQEGTFPEDVQVRFYAGYAGWGPNQLDQEMTRGAWLTHPASLDIIFHPSPELVWKQVLRAKGPEYRLLSEAPDDISLN